MKKILEKLDKEFRDKFERYADNDTPDETVMSYLYKRDKELRDAIKKEILKEARKERTDVGRKAVAKGLYNAAGIIESMEEGI